MKAAMLVGVAALLLGGVSHAQDAGRLRLSLEEAIERAATGNHQVRMAERRVHEASGQNLQSWSGFLPRVTVSENYVRSNDPVTVFGTKLKQGIFTQQDFDLQALNTPDDIDNFSTRLHIEQPLFNADALFGKAAASSARKASELGLARTRQAIALEVKRTYYGLILAHASSRTIDRAVASAEAHYREVEAAYRQGLVSEADLLSAQVRVGELKEQLLIADNAMANASDGLGFLLGLERNIVIEPADSLGTDPLDANIDEAAARVDQRADVQALAYQHKAVHRSSWMTRSEWIPRVNAFGTVEWNDESAFGQDSDNWTVGVQLEWSLLDGLGRWGRARQASARAESARLNYEERRALGRTQLRQAARSFRTAKERIGVAETAVDQARQSLRIMEDRFEEGLERVSDLLAREAAFTAAQLRLLQAKHDLNVAYAEVVFYGGAK